MKIKTNMWKTKETVTRSYSDKIYDNIGRGIIYITLVIFKWYIFIVLLAIVQIIEGILTNAITAEAEAGKFKYVLIGGVEIGDEQYRDDYLIKHVHVAAIFNNRVTKASILKNWKIKQGDVS